MSEVDLAYRTKIIRYVVTRDGLALLRWLVSWSWWEKVTNLLLAISYITWHIATSHTLFSPTLEHPLSIHRLSKPHTWQFAC